MTRTWTPRPLVREQAENGLWAGALPDGPIVRLDDMGALLLETLLEATADADPGADRTGDGSAMRAASAAEVLALLDGVLENVPDDAESALEEFFTQLAASGLVDEHGRRGSTEDDVRTTVGETEGSGA